MEWFRFRLPKITFGQRQTKKDSNSLLLVLPQKGEDMDEILEKAVRESLRREKYVLEVGEQKYGSGPFWFYLKDELKEWWSGCRWWDNNALSHLVARPAFIGNKLLILMWLSHIYRSIDVGFFSIAINLPLLLTGSIGFLFVPGIYLGVKYKNFRGWKRSFERKVRAKKAQLAPSAKRECIAQLYKGLVDDYSNEIIGNNSSIHAVLVRVGGLAKEAKESLEYWTGRLENNAETGGEEGSYLKERISLAEQFVRKFEEIKSKLESQREILQGFFEEVRGEIPVIESVMSDYFENRRLQRFAVELEIIEPEADVVALNVFYRFGEDLMLIQNISARLNGVNAADLSVGQLESCALRIFKIGEYAEKRTRLLEAKILDAGA